MIQLLVSAALGAVPTLRRAQLRERALTAELRTIGARLAREERARAEFVSKVSHELRTPLTVIKGYVYSLQRGETDPGRMERLRVIDGECERLAYLVEDLLELSRARAGELRVSVETFALAPFVEDVVERLQTLAEQAGVRLELRSDAGDAEVMGDRNRIRQILVNLISNGIKYAPPETAVVVEAHVLDGDVLISVEDSGRGIADADLPFIFDEFFQSGTAEAGAGLGLAIARELAEAHGGRIDVASSVGEGTRFTLVLPAWEELP